MGVAAALLVCGWVAQAWFGAPDAVGFAAIAAACAAPFGARWRWQARYERARVAAFLAQCADGAWHGVERVERGDVAADVLARGTIAGARVQLERVRVRGGVRYDVRAAAGEV